MTSDGSDERTGVTISKIVEVIIATSKVQYFSSTNAVNIGNIGNLVCILKSVPVV